MTVYLPLRGPNDRGLNPKGVKGGGWQDPTYFGIDPAEYDGWVGMRLDNRIVVDCDNEEAMEAWLKHVDQPLEHTWVRKTPHGWHFIYWRTPNTYGLTACKLTAVHPKIDFKVGPGHQIVLLAPGYENVTTDEMDVLPFNPSWMPAVEKDRPVIEWSEMPDGSGDNAMISFAGKFREWGMDVPTIEKVLGAINEITMTEDPMKPSAIRRIAKSSGRWDPDEPQIIECPKCGTELETR